MTKPTICEGCIFSDEVYGSSYCGKHGNHVRQNLTECNERKETYEPPGGHQSRKLEIPIPRLPKRQGMKSPVFYGLGFRLVFLCILGMFATFIPEQWQVLAFFGDQYECHEAHGFLRCHSVSWAPRHYWYAWTVGFLFCLSLVDAVIGVVLIIRENYDTSKW